MRSGIFFLLFMACLQFDAGAQRKPANGRNNEDYVWLFDQKGKLQRMFPLQKPAFENRNNRISVSVSNDSNELFQINGIPVSWLKDTIIKSASVKVVLIRKNGTWTSADTKSTTEVHIRCRSNKPGSPLSIRVLASIQKTGKPGYKTEARLNGIVPQKQDVIMNLK